MTDLVKAFSKHLEVVGRKQGLSKVFNDLLRMGICSFHRVNIRSRLTEKDETNEALYFETIKPYTKEELTELAKALGVLQVNVLKNPYSDILGDYFTLQITRGQNGQFFTPDPVCQFMAAITHGDKDRKGARFFDPACGSGRMLLAAAKNSPDNFFFGADNDQTCASMATLNFFLNGLRGEVAWMNSLTNEWYGGWHINLNGLGIVPIEKEQSYIWLKEPSNKKDTMTDNGQQFTLF